MSTSPIISRREYQAIIWRQLINLSNRIGGRYNCLSFCNLCISIYDFNVIYVKFREILSSVDLLLVRRLDKGLWENFKLSKSILINLSFSYIVSVLERGFVELAFDEDNNDSMPHLWQGAKLCGVWPTCPQRFSTNYIP